MNPIKLTPPSEFFSAPLWERQEYLRVVFKSLDTDRGLDICYSSLYKEARLYGLVSCSYQEFIKEFKPVRRRPIPGWWYYRHGTDFRCPLHYQRKSHHKKRVLSSEQLSAMEWREKKGFSKDRKRSYYGSRKKVAKRLSNRSYRAWVKQVMDREDYDLLSSQLDKSFFDPWDWD